MKSIDVYRMCKTESKAFEMLDGHTEIKRFANNIKHDMQLRRARI